MLCFASFATVLSLGGGPQATTIELAIHQALSYDYDPPRRAAGDRADGMLSGTGVTQPEAKQNDPHRKQ